MRTIVLALPLLLTLLFAGCVTPPATTTTPTNGTSNTTADTGALPPAINDTKQVQGGLQPITDPVAAPCEAPTAQCYRYPFELNVTATIVATLSWGTPANDFDLYVFQDGAVAFQNIDPPPGTEAKIEEELEPGSYELVVALASVAQDTYKLAAEFTAGPP